VDGEFGRGVGEMKGAMCGGRKRPDGGTLRFNQSRPVRVTGEPVECDACKALWGLLDDIDTASDMFKPRDLESYQKFYKYAMARTEARHLVCRSDGYELFKAERVEE